MSDEAQKETSDGKDSIVEQKLNYKINDELVQVDLKGLKRFFADLDRYNKRYSIGGIMGDVIASALETKDNENTPRQTNIADETSKQQADAFFFDAAHKNTLDSIGLSLEPVALTATVYSGGESADVSQMRLNIENRDRFTSFLSALNPKLVEEASLEKDLEKIPTILTSQILDHYNFESNKPSAEILELFGGLEKIIDEYNRLGMGESVKRLRIYLEHGRKGDLREYIAIERRNLLSQPKEGFGPADWQTDSTPEYLKSRWREALYILNMVEFSFVVFSL